MALNRTEVPHFTREQIEQHVMDTLEVAAAAGLVGEDRAALLPAIFDKVASKQVMLEQVGGLTAMHIRRNMG